MRTITRWLLMSLVLTVTAGTAYAIPRLTVKNFYNEKTKGFTLPIIGSAAVAKTAYVLLEIRIIDNTTSRIIYASEQLGSAKQNAKGNLNSYQGFFIGGHQKTYGGILALATRDAVKKHVKAIRAKVWE